VEDSTEVGIHKRTVKDKELVKELDEWMHSIVYNRSHSFRENK
jgi:hypothetical protein